MNPSASYINYCMILDGNIQIYRVADLSEDIEISQKLSPANKNVLDKSCMVSRGT